MKTKYILTAIVVSASSMVFAGNDPQQSVSNYKHSSKAAKAQELIDARDGQEITVVVKETKGSGGYKNNFQEATYSYVKAKANQETYPSNSNPQSHNYKNQF